MKVKGFEIRQSGPGRLEASGELTFATAAQALRNGTDLIGGGTTWVVDLSGVEAGDSAGIAVLIEWLVSARGHGANLRYENVPAQMLAIARISDLEVLLLAA
jgi:phospholipid transport system transporter-binding protein